MHDETFDLQACLREARQGDQGACRQLVSQLYPLVAKIVAAYAPRGVVVEDWHQEIFVRMFVRLEQYRADAPFENWLSRIAVNTCIDLLRQRMRKKEIRLADLSEFEADALQASLTSKTQDIDAVASRELIDKLLDGLSAEDRVVLTMLDMEQKSIADIAEHLGRTVSWVKVRAHRARKKLRPILERLMRESNNE